jgi:hypothetical protein
MLSKKLFNITRSFSNKLGGSNRGMVGRFNIVYIMTTLVLANGYYYFSYSQVDRNSQSNRFIQADRISSTLPKYTGVSRPINRDQFLKFFSDHQSLIIFGPTLQGKSEFIKYLASVQPIVYLPIQESFLDTMNIWEFTEEFEEKQFNEFMGVLEYMSTRGNDAILVIDQFEKLPENYKIRILDSISYWVEKKTMKIVIVTNSEEVLHLAQHVLDNKVWELPDMDKEEFIEAVKIKGANENLAKSIWENCGFDIEVANKSIQTGDLKTVLNQEKDFLINELKNSNKNEFEGVKKALATVASQRPLGDIFKGTAGAVFLQKVGACKSYVGYVRFRNKFVVDVFKKFVQEQSISKE